MLSAFRVGEFKAIKEGRVHNRSVDYVANGIFYSEGITIPCEIGYNSYPSDILRADYIFIKEDGVTEDGYHYYKETIDVNERGIIIHDEEA